MDELSALAFKAYRGLVYETQGFADYFWGSTVINEIADAEHRQPPGLAQDDARDRRSARHPLGVLMGAVPADAAGLVRLRQRGRGWIAEEPCTRAWPSCRSSIREWPFFRMLLSNMDMVLAKSSIAIASRYAELVPDVELREKIFGRIAPSGTTASTSC